MKIYRIKLLDEYQNVAAHAYYGNITEALNAQEQNDKQFNNPHPRKLKHIETIAFTPTKKDVLHMMNVFAWRN